MLPKCCEKISLLFLEKLFFVALGLCYMQAFSNCGKLFSLVAEHGLLAVVASLVAEHGL